MCEGAVINYTKDDTRFDVLGTVVVSADYIVSNQPRSVVKPLTYWAKVSWPMAGWMSRRSKSIRPWVIRK